MNIENFVCEYSSKMTGETDLRMFIGYLAKCIDGQELRRFYGKEMREYEHMLKSEEMVNGNDCPNDQCS